MYLPQILIVSVVIICRNEKVIIFIERELFKWKLY